ncbi:MAG: hypothetical protein HC913_14140 [Microscillaceae bacterium]|nr:hypothetical protein [Microscillaceae bacterium]
MHHQHISQGWYWLLGYGLALSLGMRGLAYPQADAEHFFLNSEIYQSAPWALHLADALLNLLVVSVWLAYLAFFYSRMSFTHYLLRCSARARQAWAVLAIVLAALGVHFLLGQVGSVFQGSALNLDIRRNLGF